MHKEQQAIIRALILYKNNIKRGILMRYANVGKFALILYKNNIKPTLQGWIHDDTWHYALILYKNNIKPTFMLRN